MKYHEAEHYQFPHTPVGVLQDELHYYPKPPEFRGAINGLGRLYEKYNLYQACKKFAALMAIASPAPAQATATLNYDRDFMAGEVLGMHSLVWPLPRIPQEMLLGSDPLMQYPEVGADIIQSDDKLRYIIGRMTEFREQGWRDTLSSQHADLRAGLYDAAAVAFGDKTGVEQRQEAFIVGHVFMSDIITALAHQANNSPN
jgi:hypothetical protein